MPVYSVSFREKIKSGLNLSRPDSSFARTSHLTESFSLEPISNARDIPSQMLNGRCQNAPSTKQADLKVPKIQKDEGTPVALQSGLANCIIDRPKPRLAFRMLTGLSILLLDKE